MASFVKNMKQFKIPYAKRVSDGMPIDALSYNNSKDDEKDLICYECRGTLSYRRNCEKKRKASGLVYQVRAHFYHAGESSCRGESTEHLMAKEIVASFTKFDFIHSCTTCYCDYRPIALDNYHTKMEYQWRDPVDDTLFIPDVAYLDKDDIMRGVVEIHHTHRIPEVKVVALNNAAIKWVEVSSRHIIEQYNAKKNIASVQRSSAFHIQCSACDTRDREFKLIQERARLVAIQERADEYRRLKEKEEADARTREEEAEKARIAHLERLENQRKEKEKADALAIEVKQKRVDAARKKKEKQDEEAKMNEKKRNDYYRNEREKNEKRTKGGEKTQEEKEAFLNKVTQDNIDREYEDRKRHLMAYQNMIVEARKKRRENKEISMVNSS